MDGFDFRIVQLLDRNSRESFARIAGAVGLTSRTVQRRVARMVETGFIRGFDVMVEPSSLDLGEAVCDVQIKANAKKEEVRKRMLEIPNLNEIITLVGDSFVVYACYRDSVELESILTRISATVGVADIQYEVNPRTGKQASKLSRQSWLLIHSLNHRSRREMVDISQELGLSTRTVQRNLRWLEKNGAVRFGVDVDVSKAADLLIYVLVIRLQIGVAKTKTLERIQRTVATVWRELRTINPHTIILLLYARQTMELEKDVETVRLANGVTGVRVLMITGDTRNASVMDARIAAKAKGEP